MLLRYGLNWYSSLYHLGLIGADIGINPLWLPAQFSTFGDLIGKLDCALAS